MPYEEGKLNNIPVVSWISETIDKMNQLGANDLRIWNQKWLESYFELGGHSKNSGSKDCPKHAAYGLWRLGFLVNGGVTKRYIYIKGIDSRFGKNATYAVLALQFLERGYDPYDIPSLWAEVQSKYREVIKEEPAKSNQGAVTIAAILYREGYIVPD